MLKILYISSANPAKGPGALAIDHYMAMKNAGFQVDFLTLMKSAEHPEFKYIYKNKPSKHHNLKYKIFRKLRKGDPTREHAFFYLKESDPPVPIKRILKRIDNDYDLIIIFFWQQLLSYKSVLEIFRHCSSRPKVVFICADYSPMTGGCHFMADCTNYQSGCGKCPMINSDNANDFTAKNVDYRRKAVEEIRPYLLVNSYMREFFNRSAVMQSGAKLKLLTCIVNHHQFRYMDKTEGRARIGIPQDKFVILFGAQDLTDHRKGMIYLIEALNLLYESLPATDRERILLLSIGKDDDQLSDKIKISRKHLGYVEYSLLPEIYSLADVFLSPSVNDAGPSMVNQSLACGTPVVAFEMGTALDVVKGRGTGATVPLGDTVAFSYAISDIYSLPQSSYSELRARCRKVSEELQSYSSFANLVKAISDDYRP